MNRCDIRFDNYNITTVQTIPWTYFCKYRGFMNRCNIIIMIMTRCNDSYFKIILKL